MKKVAILGITGSIGASACEIVRNHKDDFQIILASAHNNPELLLEAGREFQIPYLCLTGKQQSKAKDEIYYGQETLLKLLDDLECDIVLNAVSGSAGLPYTIKVLQNNTDLALANKESLVMAGHLVQEILKTSTSKILPVDSEHSALFQALGNHQISRVRKLHLTASGGPFRTLPLPDFSKITLEQTLKHPTWDMGAKVTIDSATMMNKGLEVIEAHWLFGIGYDRIQAVLHPQSIIHSMVEFIDGSILAQMSTPSMQLPILYAFTYPDRIESSNVKTNVLELQDLTFSALEKERYPMFYLVCEVAEAGGILPTIMNSANEAAIKLFLERKIHFTDIFKIVDKVIQKSQNIEHPDLVTIQETNTNIYQQVLAKH